MRIRTLLIANRGEIACRIIKTAKKRKIRTLIVYSQADAASKAVRMADRAIALKGRLLSETYLDAATIVRLAKRHGADAIHPGYGFLSENAAFAKLTTKAGMLFIGPSAQALATLGDKLKALQIAKSAKIPALEGVLEPVQSLAQAIDVAKKTGFPIIFKAAHGGGGRGMRIVHNAEQMAQAFTDCRAESKKAFGSDALFIERYVEEAKHIEVQIARDSFGNTHCYLERDCSMQRRHQKVIEEAPGPTVDAQLRSKLQRYARALVEKVGYVGIGTVEFLVDRQMNPFFMEVNARIQVEHPVTEMLFNVDFVDIQLRIAQGEAISSPPTPRGHAIEARIIAENPYEAGLPQMGTLTDLHIPRNRWIRWESSAEKNTAFGGEYDSLIGKLICHGKNRAEAYRRLAQALRMCRFSGIITNTAFLLEILQQAEFVSGVHTTLTYGRCKPLQSEVDDLAAALALLPKRYPRIVHTWKTEVERI